MTDTSHHWLEASQLRDPSARGLSSHVAELIRTGELRPGATLPPVRRIAEVFRVSPATVSSAWNVLKKRGMLRGTGRSGVRVTDVTGPTMGRDFYSTIPGGNDLRLLYPDVQLLPPLDKALAAAAQLPHLNEYYGNAILPDLLDVVQPTWPYPAESFLVTNGASDALWTVLRSHTVPGDRIVIETPTQPQLLPVIEELGLTAVPVAYTAEGLDFDGFQEALSTRPAAVFFQPRAQVPTGLSTSQHNVDRIVELLRSLPYRPLIIEYDDLGDLARDTHHSIGMHLPDQVTLIRSYEKSYGPDLRLAVISSSRALMSIVHPHVRRTRQWTSRILQKALAWLCEDPESQALVHRAREVYGKRLDRFVEALTERGIEVSNRDGLCAWIPVIDEVACVTELARQGVLILAGGESLGGTPGQFVRVATSGLNDDQIEPLAHQVAAARVLFN